MGYGDLNLPPLQSALNGQYLTLQSHPTKVVRTAGGLKLRSLDTDVTAMMAVVTVAFDSAYAGVSQSQATKSLCGACGPAML